MDIRKSSLALAVTAVIAPALAQASAEKIALNACANAFATSISSPGAAPAYKLNYQGNQFSSTLADYYDREYTFYLKANNLKTGVPLARATCSTDSHGRVVELTATPLQESSTLLSAQL